MEVMSSTASKINRPSIEDDDNYLLPFGKMSQTARRIECEETQPETSSEIATEEECYSSQDLFKTQEILPARYRMATRLSGSLCRNYPNTQQDTIRLVQSTASSVDKMAQISGYQMVKVCRGERLNDNPNTREGLPHPTKLFRRKKLMSSCRKPGDITTPRDFGIRTPHNHSVAIHLKQLRMKHSKIDVIRCSDISEQADSNTVMTSRIKTEDVGESNVSDWEAIETWIHGRWKSRSGHHLNQHTEEE